MRGELGGVEHDGDAALVGGGDQGAHRRQPARDVGRPRAGEEDGTGRGVEAGHHVVEVEGPVRPALHVAPAGHAPPGQQVGVVLDHRGEHDVVGGQAQAVGEVVERLGGVAPEDGHVAGPRPGDVAPGEGEHPGPGRLIRLGGLARFVSRPPVDARVQGDEALHRIEHRRQGARRRREVEAHVAALDTVHAGHAHVVAHQHGGRVSGVRHGAQSTRGRSRPFGGPTTTIAAVEHPLADVAYEPGADGDDGPEVWTSGVDDATPAEAVDEVDASEFEVPDGDAPDIDASLLDSIEERLADVERALARLDEGTYGTCEVCGATIDDAVLVDAPATRFCLDHLPISLG